ncbi:hypothetical protein Tco_0893663 [Tanacetum coccineum]|uniref:Uncharacterized protein n=1 Tax=Tanacetum coccineum TaxID=301880 RepID=A0ABQ5C9J7_9ASTR
MPRATTTDISLTKSNIPKVSKILGICPTIAKFYKSIENHNIHEEQYNLATLCQQNQWQANPNRKSSYGMFLTCLYRHIMEAFPHLDNGIYGIVDRVMRPLALKQTRRPRSDRGKARHSVSSLSSHHHGTSSHQHDDDDVETSRASTLSPTTYLN